MTHTTTQDGPRRLERSRGERRWVAGVCDGIARYFGIDPTVVRVGFVGATLFVGGAGAVAYVAALLLVPEEGGGNPIIGKAVVT